jgi:ribosomal protein S3
MVYVLKYIKVDPVTVKRAEKFGIQGVNVWITMSEILKGKDRGRVSLLNVDQ